MYNYAYEFINIYKNENYQVDYYKSSYLITFDNFESYIFYLNKLFFAIKPFIKISLEYLELTNLFTPKIKNGVVASSKFYDIIFNYKLTNLENNNFVVEFNVKNTKNKIEYINFMLVIKLFNENFVERINIKNSICYKIGFTNPIYVLSKNFTSVSYNNKTLFGKKINKVQDNSLYLDFNIKLIDKSSAKVFVFSKFEYLAKFINLNENVFIKESVILPNFSTDLTVNNDKIDSIFLNLVDNLFVNLYKSYHIATNFCNKLCFLLAFDRDLITLKPVDNLSYLVALLRYYNLYNESFTDNIRYLIDAVNKNLSSFNEAKYHILIDLFVEIENVETHILLNELYELKTNIKKQIDSINYADMLNSLDVNDLDNILLIAKYSYYFDANLYEKLINKLKNVFFDLSFINNFSKYTNKSFMVQNNDYILEKIDVTNESEKEDVYNTNYENINGINLINSRCTNDIVYEKYYQILYYLYNNSTKDKIYNLIINDGIVCVEKLQIIVEKIVGYKFKDNLISVMPNLPSGINKILFNYKFKQGVYTVIAKKSADIFTVNNVKYNKKMKVKAINGYIKIVSSSC